MEVIHSELSDELTNFVLDILKSLEKWDAILIVRDGMPLFHVKNVRPTETRDSNTEMDAQYTQAMLATSLIQVVRELSKYRTEETKIQEVDDDTETQNEVITLLKGLKCMNGSKSTELLIYGSKKPEFSIIITHESRRFVLDPKTIVHVFASFLKDVKEKMISMGILSD